jgi:hypothetical protein
MEKAKAIVGAGVGFAPGPITWPSTLTLPFSSRHGSLCRDKWKSKTDHWCEVEHCSLSHYQSFDTHIDRCEPP